MKCLNEFLIDFFFIIYVVKLWLTNADQEKDTMTDSARRDKVVAKLMPIRGRGCRHDLEGTSQVDESQVVDPS